MDKFNFTKQALEAKKPSAARLTFHDQRTAGLILRLEPSGQKSFCWLRKGAGMVRFKRIGPFPDISIEQARGKAGQFNAALAKWLGDDCEGDSPFQRVRGVTLGAVLEDYVVHHILLTAKNPEHAAKTLRWQFGKYLPGFRDRKLNTIRPEHIRDVNLEHRKIGIFTANRQLQLLKLLFNWATENLGWTGGNPADKIRMTSERPFQRKRFLQPDELARLFAALRVEPNRNLRDFVVLALFTGARKSDIFGMRWEHINFHTLQWYVPYPKSKIPYYVDLMPEAVEILKERYASRVNEWVLPSRDDKGHIKQFNTSWFKLLERAKIVDLRMHDLRRTLGSYMATQGSSLLEIGAALGHTSIRSTQVYAHLVEHTVQQGRMAARRAMLTAGSEEQSDHNLQSSTFLRPGA